MLRRSLPPMRLFLMLLPILMPPLAVVAAEAVPADPEAIKLGGQQFVICGACHGQSGAGTAAGPPLAGSEWVLGPEENLIRIQLRGLHGPIRVKGVEYQIAGGMAPLAYQTDEQIAAVLTFIRNSFGNSAPAVTPSAVAALRGEVGKPPVTVADLTPPPSLAAAPSSAGKYDNLGKSKPWGLWIAVIVAMALAAAAWVAKSRRQF